MNVILSGQTKEITFSITLLASGWSNKTQTVSNSLFKASNYGYIISPSANSFSSYASAMCKANDISTDGQITFTCSEIPTEDLEVSIIRSEVIEQ